MAQKTLIQHVALERKCNEDELESANVDCLPFSPRSKSWLKSQTLPPIIPKTKQKPISLTEFGWNGREKISHSAMKHGPGYALFLRHGLEPNIFPPGPSTQSINRIINVNVVSYDVNQPAAMAQGQGVSSCSPFYQGDVCHFAFQSEHTFF